MTPEQIIDPGLSGRGAAEHLLGVELVDVDFEVDEVVVVVNHGNDICVVIGTTGGTRVRHIAHQILAEVGGSCVVDVPHSELRPIQHVEWTTKEAGRD